jgi:hypothetical protein
VSGIEANLYLCFAFVFIYLYCVGDPFIKGERIGIPLTGSDENNNHPRLKTTITIASKQQSPSPQNSNHPRLKTTITLAANPH